MLSDSVVERLKCACVLLDLSVIMNLALMTGLFFPLLPLSSSQLPPETDISKFLTELLKKAREFEEHKKVNHTHPPDRWLTCIHCMCVVQFLEGMSQKIVKGIEEAQTDLSKEKQKKDEEVFMCSYCTIINGPLTFSSLCGEIYSYTTYIIHVCLILYMWILLCL